MYSSNDFERLFIRYKLEALTSGESIKGRGCPEKDTLFFIS